MVSTPPPSDDAEGHPPEESPHDEEEPKSASPSKKEAKQPKTSNRGHKLRHKQPAHYRKHTNDFSSQAPCDPVMRQAMLYGVDPNTYPPPPPGAYPPNTNPSYYPSPNLTPPAGYPSPYTYPGGGGYFSTPRASVRDPQYFSTPGYDVPPSGYSDPGFAPADSYEYEEEIPPYPEYPTREPKRAAVRPRPLRQPKPQTEPTLSTLRRDAAYQRPRQRRPSVPTRERGSSEDGITMQDIMAELRNLQRQVYQAEIQSDPGRIQGRPRRSPSVTSQYTSDDTRSLNIERERSRQLTSIIYRLLEDRQRPEYQDSLGLSSRQTMMDLLQGRVREHDGEMALVSQKDAQEIRSKLDTILDYLELQGGWEDEPAPQRLREGHESRPQPLVLRGQPSVASGSSVHTSSSPTLSRTTPRRRQTLPSVIRPPQDAQSSNQGRTRQVPTTLGDDDEMYEDFRRPARTRVSSTQSVASQDRRRLQTSVVQRSDARPPERKIVEGDQQKVRPGRFAYVQTEDEQDEEPARAPVPPYPVPDPPGRSKRRRSLQSVRFR
ncbi:uncharacterized protein FTJAE_4112 [Fusarium tjaetaba]|uniref:Uncharacterized protein n=1 Tax=Fusarium tjaetaba TaxID=1567544 RepID=A0A8H5RYN1_9HYPO|nr:uncharacterized protein FTJAE_4112 [Fusarium tjaetaba]KAF5641460.1 hypothetical protein FTJAE_4112 [Fusarium tjaetaba]